MEAHISHTYASYVIDPQVYGLDASIWKTVSGSPTVTSNKYRLNIAEILSYSQFRYGEFEFNLTVPVAPTVLDDRIVGLRSKSLGNRSRITFTFDTTGNLYAHVYGKTGTALFAELIPWNTAWSNTATLFRIGWTRGAVVFTIALPDGTENYSVTYNAGMNPIVGSLNIDIANTNADNLDVASVAVIHSNPSIPLNGGSSISAIIPGTGATNLGKAEDAAHTSGDTGVMVLARRADTASSSATTDGDYATLNTDSTGHLHSAEGFAPGAENNTDNVIHTAFRAISSSTGAVSTDISAALEASSVTKASAGRLYGMVGYVDGALATGTYYILFMNASSLPADGAVTLLASAIPVVHTTGTPTRVDVDFSNIGGIYASTGIVSCISTTALTKTIGGAYLNTVIFYS